MKKVLVSLMRTFLVVVGRKVRIFVGTAVWL